MALQLQAHADVPTATRRREPSSLGVFYPRGDVIAVIDDEREAVRAIADLRAAGVAAADIELLDGDDILRLDDTFRRRRSALSQLAALIASLVGDDGRYEQEYLDEARQGHRTLVVHAPPPTLVQGIRGALVSNHAHHARYYRSVVVEDLA